MSAKSKKSAIISCFILFVLSVCGGLYYIIPQLNPNNEENNPEYRPIIQNATGIIPIYFDDNMTHGIEGRVIIGLNTPEVFAVQNTVYYFIEAYPNVNNHIYDIKNLKRVVVVLGFPNEDYSYLNTNNIDSFVTEHQTWYADVVDLNIANGFFRQATITFHQQHDLVAYALIFRENSIQPEIGISKPIITINSPVATIQIDSLKEQKRNDSIILGLTLFIVSWIPLDVGFRLRYDVWKSTFPKKSNLETNQWNCDWFPNE